MPQTFIKFVMPSEVAIILCLICFCGAEPIKRPFIHNAALTDEIQTIVNYFGVNNDKIQFEDKTIDISENGINQAFSSFRNDGKDTVFAYLPDMNFTMLNEYAVKYNIYVWNAITFPEGACFTNIIFGYDFPLTSLKIISLRVANLQHFGYAYDSSKINKNYIAYLEKTLQFLRVTPEIKVDQQSSTDGATQILNSIDYAGLGDGIFVLLDYYTDDNLINAWHGHINNTKVRLVIMETHDRTVYKNPKVKGAKFQLANAYLPEKFFEEINGNLGTPVPTYDNKDFTQESIMLFQMGNLYYKIGMEYLDGDFSRGYEIVLTGYSIPEMTDINGTKVTIVSANKLQPVTQSGDYKEDTTVSGGNGITTNQGTDDFVEYEPDTSVSYTYVDGFPIEEICDIKDNVINAKTTKLLYIVFMTYKSILSNNNLAKYESNLIDSLNAAVEYINSNVNLLDKTVYAIHIDITTTVEKAYEEFKERFIAFEPIAIFSSAEYDYRNEFLSKLVNDPVISPSGISSSDILYIQIIPSSGNQCKKNVVSGISLYSWWKYGLQVLAEELLFSKLFIAYAENDYFSANSAKGITNLTAGSGTFTSIVSFSMEEANTPQAQNICGSIYSECTPSGGCIIVNVLPRSYQEIFFKYYADRHLEPEDYPVVSMTLDEAIIENSESPTYYDQQYIIQYYVDDLNTTEVEEFKEYLYKVNTSLIPVITPEMGYAYTSVKNLANIIELAQSTSSTKISSMIKYSSAFDGVGGKIEWNEQGYINCDLHFAKYNATEKRFVTISTSPYIEQTNSFNDISKKCDWFNGVQTATALYDVVFLYVTDDYISDYLNDYTKNANVMIDFVNNAGGVNEKLLRATIELFGSINELKTYVADHANDENILAFVGTTSNEQRDAISDILIENDKLLFSIHPSEGERCYSNIIQVGRVPNQYVNAMASRVWKESEDRKVIFVSFDNSLPKNVIYNVKAYFDTFKLFNSSSPFIINETMTVDYFVSNITDIYGSDKSIFIITAVGKYTNELLEKLEGTKFILFVLDARKYFINNDRWINSYVMTSYLPSNTNAANTIFKKTFQSEFGTNEELLNENAVNIYTSLMFLKNAYSQATEFEFNEIKRQLTQLTLNLPVGENVEINARDYTVTNFYHVSRIEDDSLVMVEKTSNVFGLVVSPYLQYRADKDPGICSLSGTTAAKGDIMYVIINPDEDVVFMMLNAYLMTYSIGTSNGFSKVYCGEFNATDLHESDIVITSCSTEEQIQMTRDNDNLLIVSIIDKDYGACYNKVIDIGTSPAQRIVPYVSYIITYFSKDIMLIMGNDTSFEEKQLLNETIIHMGGTIKDMLLVLDEDDVDSTKVLFDDFISSYQVSIPDGGVFLNYLKKKSSYQNLFKAYSEIMLNEYASVAEASKKYIIFSWYTENQVELDIDLVEGHFMYASSYADSETAPNIYTIGTNVLGPSYVSTSIQSRAISAFEFMKQAYFTVGSFKKDAMWEYVSNNEISTPFGNLKMSKNDTSITFPMYVIQSSRENEVSKVKRYMLLSRTWPGQQFRKKFNTNSYAICNKYVNEGELYLIDPIKFLILLPLSGRLSYFVNAFVSGYLVAVDYVNEYYGGIKGRMIVPVLMNSESNLTIVKSILRTVKQEYGTRIIFGLAESNIRKNIQSVLRENDLLLFYPTRYEGFECYKNVIYMSPPFTEYTSALVYFYARLATDIYIIYSDSVRDSQNAYNTQHELNKRGINVVNMLKIPLENYKIDIILSIIVNEMKSGIIASFLDGKAATDIFTALHAAGYDSSTYIIYSFNIQLSDVIDKSIYPYLDGHYFVEGLSTKLFKTNAITELDSDRYSYVQEEGSVPAILTVLFAVKALNNTEFDYTDDKVNYTLDGVLKSLHNSNLSDVIDNITINSNNQISLYYEVNKVVYNAEDGSFTKENVVHVNRDDNVNPYNSQYNLSGIIYTCDWSYDNDNVTANTTTDIPSTETTTLQSTTSSADNDEISTDTSEDNGIDDESDYNGKKPQKTVNIALLYEITSLENSAYNIRALDIMIGIIDSINQENLFNYTYFNYIIFDVSDETNLTNIGNAIISDESIILAIGCYDDNCRITISEIFDNSDSERKLSLWFPSPSSGEECNKYTFYTGLVPSTYVKPLSSFLDQINNNNMIYLIGEDTDSDKILHKILMNAYEGLHTTMGDSYIESGSSGLSYTVANTIITKCPKGCSVISTLDRTSAIDFINYFDTLITTSMKDLFHVIILELDEDIVSSFKISGNVHYYIGASYFEKINPTCSFVNTILRNYGTMTSNELAHNSYLALRIWVKAASVVGYTDREALRKELYSSTYEGCVTTVMMFSNNHLSLPYYIMEVGKDLQLTVAYSQTRIQEPLAWSWDLEESDGKICDWSVNGVGEKGSVESFTIAVALSLSGAYRDIDMYVLNIFELIFSDLNNNKQGLLGKRVTVESFDIESNDNICANLLKDYLQSKEDGKGDGVIFTSASTSCINMISAELVTKNIPMFIIGYTGGEECYDNVFYIQKEPSFVDRIIDYMVVPSDPKTLTYCVVAPSDAIGQNYYDYILKYLNFIGAIVAYGDKNSKADASDFGISVENMVDQAADGCNILFIGSVSMHVGLDEALTNAKVDRDKYPIISLTTASNAAAKGVYPFYSAQDYFTNLDNELNKQMKDDILSVTNYVTEPMFVSYVISKMYINAVNTLKKSTATDVREFLYTATFESPSGTLSIGYNNYMNHFIFFGLMKEDDPEYGFDLIFKSSEIHTSNTWKHLITSGFYRCNFHDTDEGSSYIEPSISIGILTSYSGEYSTTEISITRGIILAVNQLNKNGGILDKKIDMVIRDAKSDINLYVKYAKELTRLDNVVLVFGGSRAVIYEELTPYFESSSKLFFFTGIATTENCPKYSFKTQMTVSQMVNGIWKYILPNVDKIYIIQDESKLSQQFSRGLDILCEKIHIETHVFNYTWIIDPNTALEEVKAVFPFNTLDKRSGVILTVEAENNKPILDWLCSNSFVASKTYVVSATLDRYLMEFIDGKCLTGAYLLTPFIKEMGLSTSDTTTYLSSAEEFVSSFLENYGDMEHITASTESGYSAITLWSDVVSAYTMSFDNDKVRKALYGFSTVIPSGSVVMNSNGFASRIIYLCLINNDKSMSVYDYASSNEEGEAWNHVYPENEGFVCDWSTADGGHEKYRPDSLKIIFLHETNELRSKEVNSMIMEYSLVKDLNSGGMNGRQIVPIFIFANTYEEFNNATAQYLNDEEVIAFFGCSNDDCIRNAREVAGKTGTLWMYYSELEGNTCYGNRIAISSTPAQRFLSAEYYLDSIDVRNLVFIGDDTEIMDDYYNTVYYYVKNHYNTMKQTIRRVTITDESEIPDVLSDIKRKKENDDIDRVGLLYYLSGSLSNSFIDVYTSNSFNSREILIVFMNYVDGDYSATALSNIYGSLVINSFDSIITTALSQSFVNAAQGFLGITKTIDETIEAIKDSFVVWQTVYTAASADSGKIIPPIRYMQLSAVGLQVDVPSGLLLIDESLYVSRNSFIFEINRNAKFIQLFPSSGSNHLFNADPYPEGLPDECKFGKDHVFHKYNDAILGLSYALMAISLIFGISCLVFTAIHRKQKIIKTLGRAHNYMSSISIIILSISSIPITLYPSENSYVCATRVICLGVAVKGLIGTFMATEVKLYMKSRRIGNSTIKKTKIPFMLVLSYWIGFILFEAVIVLLWFLIDPNQYMEAESVSESDYFNVVQTRECTISTPFIAIELVTDFVPVVMLLYFSNATKAIANQHNDSFGMFISSIVITILGAIMVLLDFNINNDPDSVLLLRSMGIHLTGIILASLLFGLKLVNLYFDEDAKDLTSSGSAGINATGLGSIGSTSKTSHKTLSNMSFTTNLSKTFNTQTRNKFTTLTKQ